ncbi:VOC family protein [Streptomyces sp. NPDC003038]|uniref:VOC family protein n=1 Tax=unclassified Streptomyces TaxID=2593676 RepID=UPI0033AC4555
MVHWQNTDYQLVIPWMAVTPANEAISFYQDVLGVSERTRIEAGGKLIHSEQMVGDNVIIISDEIPEMGILSPKTAGGTPVTVWIQVPDSETVFDKAVKAGCKPTFPMTTMPYGDRAGGFTCPYGHNWFIATHIEDVSPQEIQRRMQAEPQA